MMTLRMGVFVLAVACGAVLAGPSSGDIEFPRLRAEIRAAMRGGAPRIELLEDATCSGGANGGMDATGNECNGMAQV